MHSYLRAIGFGKIKKESEVEEILNEIYRSFDSRNVAKQENGAFLEMSKDFSPDMGICLCGTMDEQGFHREYYFPYYRSSGATTSEELTIEKRAGGDSFACVCDDGRIGVSLIFYLQNPAEYCRENQLNYLKGRNVATTLTGLASDGMILLPVCKNEKKEEERRRGTAKRTKLLNAAKNGDQDAIESLTMEDMDLYTMISRRVQREDVFSIVDTFFMPYGIECDKYQIMGVINYYTKVKNEYTGEYVYQINLECNDMNFDICINAADLLGEPEEGRRFKGTVWLQGRINFEL